MVLVISHVKLLVYRHGEYFSAKQSHGIDTIRFSKKIASNFVLDPLDWRTMISKGSTTSWQSWELRRIQSGQQQTAWLCAPFHTPVERRP